MSKVIETVTKPFTKILGLEAPEMPDAPDPGLTEQDRSALAETEAQRKAQKKKSGTQSVLTSPLGSGAPTTNRPTLG